jgi:hypothetical protein
MSGWLRILCNTRWRRGNSDYVQFFVLFLEGLRVDVWVVINVKM